MDIRVRLRDDDVRRPSEEIGQRHVQRVHRHVAVARAGRSDLLVDHDLPDEMLAPVFAAVRRTSIAVQKALHAQGSFVATNTRISQSVPHLHVHVVPRNKGDGLFSTRLVWQRKKYETDAEMAEIAAKIRAAYDPVR